MITIEEPSKVISDVWSKPDYTVVKDRSFRLMRYVLRVDYKGAVLLHNLVTGQLVELDSVEVELIDNLPLHFNDSLSQLIEDHYLVPEDFDEHLQVVKMRKILRLLNDSQPKSVTAYTILPTTGCNARCYYCFESGVKTHTMTEQIANKVVEYIVSHCGEKKDIHINWFGGEPTLAINRIDQICEKLRLNGIHFQSSMVSNGYLLDADIVKKAKDLWNLYHIQISVDGTEKNNNYIKNYVYSRDNPYQRVIRNIGILIDSGIKVSVRMNFDIGNYEDFKDLVEELCDRFNKTNLLDVYATPVLGLHKDREGKILHGDDHWLEQKIVELNDIARDAGIARRSRRLPNMEFAGCSAESDSYVLIAADGSLAKCLELFDEKHVIGNIFDGITNTELLQSWKDIADYDKCINCKFFPLCIKMKNCRAGDRCYHLDRNIQIELSVCNRYDEFIEKGGCKL